MWRLLIEPPSHCRLLPLWLRQQRDTPVALSSKVPCVYGCRRQPHGAIHTTEVASINNKNCLGCRGFLYLVRGTHSNDNWFCSHAAAVYGGTSQVFLAAICAGYRYSQAPFVFHAFLHMIPVLLKP
jgi:hypothetical protein